MMISSVTKKFFTEHDKSAFTLPENFALTTQYDKLWGEEGEPLSLISCLSYSLLNLIGNLHNKIMASKQSQKMKFAQVVLLSTFSTFVATPFALIETIIRLVPGLLGYAMFYLFVNPKEKVMHRKNSLTESFAGFLYVGAVCSASSTASAVSMGYSMITEDRLYNLDEKYRMPKE